MKSAFLDANVLFSAAYLENAPLAKLWKLGDVRLLSSSNAVDEAKRNLMRNHFHLEQRLKACRAQETDGVCGVGAIAAGMPPEL